MAGKAKRPGYDELAGQVAVLREQVCALKAEVHRLRAENARLRGEAPAAAEDAAGAGAEAGPHRGRRCRGDDGKRRIGGWCMPPATVRTAPAS